MSNKQPHDVARWYVIHTHPRQEERVDSNLRAWNLETFNPRMKTYRASQFTGNRTCFIKSLFPRYLFARFSADDLLHKVRFTRGVQNVISVNGSALPVDDEIIDLIRSKLGKDGCIRIGEELRAGEEVTIASGPLRNLSGVFDREVGESDRVMILLDTINYQCRVQVEKEMVRRAG